MPDTDRRTVLKSAVMLIGAGAGARDRLAQLDDGGMLAVGGGGGPVPETIPQVEFVVLDESESIENYEPDRLPTKVFDIRSDGGVDEYLFLEDN